MLAFPLKGIACPTSFNKSSKKLLSLGCLYCRHFKVNIGRLSGNKYLPVSIGWVPFATYGLEYTATELSLFIELG
jgi:hypothetical protein